VDLFAKNIYATNITADHGYFSTLSASSTITGHTILGDEVCAKKSDGTSVCVTGDRRSAERTALGLSPRRQHANKSRRRSIIWEGGSAKRLTRIGGCEHRQFYSG
jgi:hypothetical protein